MPNLGPKLTTPPYQKATTVSLLEAAIEKGVAYLVAPDGGSIGAGAFFDLVVTVGNEPAVYSALLYQLQAASSILEVYEDAELTAGTVFEPMNLNRVEVALGIEADENLVFYINGATPLSYASLGTMLISWPWVGTDTGGSAGEVTTASIDIPLILKPNTTYILRVTNTDNVAGSLGIVLTAIDRLNI